MSWYDHATLLRLRLGPWADPDGPQRLGGHRAEAACAARGAEGARAGLRPSPLRAFPGQVMRRLRAALGTLSEP